MIEMMSIAPIMPEEIRKITADEFFHLAEIGFFKEEERIELTDGVLVPISPKGVAHSSAVDRLTRWFASLAGDRFVVRIQSTVRVSDTSAVEPDVAILTGSFERYDSRHPTGSDVELVVEVAESSLETDARRKMVLYAQAGIPEYWIVDIRARRIQVHTDPSRDGYQMIHLINEFREVASHIFPESPIEVVKLLPTKTDP